MPGGDIGKQRGWPSAYVYENEFGKVILRVSRTSNLVTEEVYVTYAAKKSNGWDDDPKLIPPALYHLPNVIAAQSVIITDSEPAADAVRNALAVFGSGWAVTTWPAEPGAWPESMSKFLAGKKVFCIPENTNVSRHRMRSAAQALIGTARSVSMVLYPNLGLALDFIDAIEKSTAPAQEITEALATSLAWQPEVPGEPVFKICSVDELMGTAPVEPEWLVHGLVPAHGLGMLAGPPKKGKSTLARQLAVAVADGTEFLGRTVKQGGVLFVSLEETKENCVAHLQKLGLKNATHFHLECGAAPTTGQLAALIKKHSIQLVVFDTMLKCLGITAINDYKTMSAGLHPLQQLAYQQGTHILLIHHFNKDGNPLGSQGILAATDINIFFERVDEKAFISTQPRYGEPMEKTALVFDKEHEHYSLGKSHSVVHLEEMMAEMMAFIQHNPHCTQKEIFEVVIGKTAEKWKAFAKIREQLVKHGTGRRGDAYRFTVKEEPDGQL